jgi:hypothetical protein
LPARRRGPTRRLLWLCLATMAGPAGAQPAGRLETEAASVDVRDGDTLRPGSWRLDPNVRPDIYTVRLERGERRRVCFIAGARSLCRTVGDGDSHDFVIVRAGIDHPTRLVGRYVPPMAVFDAAWRAANRGVLTVEVPEVYELVHVAMALTPVARERRLFTGSGAYWQDMEAHFGAFAGHPLVAALDRQLRADANAYFRLRMNGYAFVYGPDGTVRRSRVYDRTGFAEQTENALLPLLPLLRSFSAQTRFRDFYRAHRALYDGQIDYYRSAIGVPRMLAWLRERFPAVRPYDSTRILFSPLPVGNQSVTWLESNGFRELMTHMDFPWPRAVDRDLSPPAAALRRGEYIFTELNHGFINPTAEPLQPRIEAAIGNRALWTTPGTASDFYGNSNSVFLEHMNWGLASLYLNDMAPAAERERMIARVEAVMAQRGFRHFAAFNHFLVALYRARPAGATIADLYPGIIAWFAAHRLAPVAPAPASS